MSSSFVFLLSMIILLRADNIWFLFVSNHFTHSRSTSAELGQHVASSLLLSRIVSVIYSADIPKIMFSSLKLTNIYCQHQIGRFSTIAGVPFLSIAAPVPVHDIIATTR